MIIERAKRKQKIMTKKSENLSTIIIFFTFMSFMYKQETDGQNVYRINAHRWGESV